MSTHAELFADQGFILLRGLLPAADVQRLHRIVQRIFRHWLDGHCGPAPQVVNMHSLTDMDFFPPPYAAERTEFFDLLAHDGLTEVIDEVFGRDVYFHGTQLFFNPIGCEKAPYWHRDLQYLGWDERRQQLALERLLHLHVRMPMVPEQGFEVIPGTHRRWDTPLEYDTRHARGQRTNNDPLPASTVFDLQPGDVLIFSAHMLHRGNYARNQMRLSLDLMLGRTDQLTTVSATPDQLPAAHEQSHIRNGLWYANTLRA